MAAPGGWRTRMSFSPNAVGSRADDKFLLMYRHLKRAMDLKGVFFVCCGVASYHVMKASYNVMMASYNVKMDRAATEELVCPFSGSKNPTYEK